jgi:Domain of unknown function (DUF4105)
MRLKNLSWIVVYGVIGLIVIGATIWGALAIWYALPAAVWVRYLLVFLCLFLGVGGLVAALVNRRLAISLAPFLAGFLALLVWWSTVEPRNDRNWQRDVAMLPSAEINGDLIKLRNVRNFAYRSETDYTPRWYDKTVDLRKLESLDLIAVYWMGDAIAHTILSFNFGGDYVAMSIEIRKEKGESFSALAGFFRRYELMYIVGDERDIIGLRSNYRKPTEDVYIYRVKAKREKIRNLFLQYVAKINQLEQRPEFYNSATTNCTTNIVTHIEAVQRNVPLSWKMLFSGYFPELVYERGGLDQSLPFEKLRQRSLINGRAQTAIDSEDFSQLIRHGLIGMPATPHQ